MNPAYVISYSDLMVPVSALDNVVLNINHETPVIKFYNYLNGDELNNQESIDLFHQQITQNALNRTYSTTDHLLYTVHISDVVHLYVSLDNSVRANMNNYPLYHTRLINILNVVRNVIDKIDSDKKIVVVFSEAFRPSFYGNINEKRDNMTWLAIMKIIKNMLPEFETITGEKNNNDIGGLSFGLHVIGNAAVHDYIDTFYNKNLYSSGFGSATVGLKYKNNEIVWLVHFPLDFKNHGNDNAGAVVMKNLTLLMDEYKGSVCAIGDMNTIPGNITNYISEQLRGSNYAFVLNNVNTFYGSFYDTIPIIEHATSIVENENQYSILTINKL